MHHLFDYDDMVRHKVLKGLFRVSEIYYDMGEHDLIINRLGTEDYVTVSSSEIAAVKANNGTEIKAKRRVVRHA